MKMVKIVCQQENKIIAEMPVPGIGQRIDSNWVWREYRPVLQEYTLPMARSKDGEYLLCPNCRGNVELVSTDIEQIPKERSVKTKDGPRVPHMSRHAARTKLVSDQQGCYHEHISSSNPVRSQGRPFILGALRVQG